MRKLHELPDNEKQDIHSVLAGMLISMAGIHRCHEMIEIAFGLVYNRPTRTSILHQGTLVTYWVAEVTLDYKPVTGLMRREMEVVLTRSDNLPATVFKSVAAVQPSTLPRDIDLQTFVM